MEDILASIKRVIAEEKELRTGVPPAPGPADEPSEHEDVLELDETMEAESETAEPLDLGPPLLDETAAGTSRQALDQRILEALSRNARMPLKELAEAAGLSSPSAAERVRRLEERGVIAAFTVDLDLPALDRREGNCAWFVDLRFDAPGRGVIAFRYGACRDGSGWRLVTS